MRLFTFCFFPVYYLCITIEHLLFFCFVFSISYTCLIISLFSRCLSLTIVYSLLATCYLLISIVYSLLIIQYLLDTTLYSFSLHYPLSTSYYLVIRTFHSSFPIQLLPSDCLTPIIFNTVNVFTKPIHVYFILHDKFNYVSEYFIVKEFLDYVNTIYGIYISTFFCKSLHFPD